MSSAPRNGSNWQQRLREADLLIQPEDLKVSYEPKDKLGRGKQSTPRTAEDRGASEQQERSGPD